MFLEFCRVKVIRVISIHDRIDSNNELFPETKPSDVLLMIGSLPDEALVLRKASEHVSKLQERMIVQLPPVSTAKERRMDREKTVINLYAAGHPIDDIWKASGWFPQSKLGIPHIEQIWYQTEPWQTFRPNQKEERTEE